MSHQQRGKSGRSLTLSPRLKRALVEGSARTNYLHFLRLAYECIEPGKMLHLNWHIPAIAYVLDQVRRGQRRRLVITTPPRCFKSTVATITWPAFLLGLDPTVNIISASYSLDLATRHANNFRAVVNSDFYRRLFPQTRTGSKNTETDYTTSRRGGRFATSVGGTLLGRGGDLILCDDLMQPEEAASEAGRERVKRWMETTLFSRLNDPATGAIVVVQQRLHVDDPVGVLLEKGGWEHLNLPAIADADLDIPLYGGGMHRWRVGDLLDERRWPKHLLDQRKADMGSAEFAAQFLQQPIPLEGNLIRRSWFRYYQHLPPADAANLMVISWDTAYKITGAADYSVATVWQVVGDCCYLVDVVRERFELPDLVRAAQALRTKYPAASILIEDKGSGTSLIQELRAQNVAVIPVKAVQDKVTRVYATQPMFEAGSVFFPERAPWLDVLQSELLAVPNSRHDDQADSVAQALNWIRERRIRIAAEPLLFVKQVWPDHPPPWA